MLFNPLRISTVGRNGDSVPTFVRSSLGGNPSDPSVVHAVNAVNTLAPLPNDSMDDSEISATTDVGPPSWIVWEKPPVPRPPVLSCRCSTTIPSMNSLLRSARRAARRVRGSSSDYVPPREGVKRLRAWAWLHFR